MGRWRWVGEDENKGWVGEDEEWVNGGRGQRMDRWRGGSGYHRQYPFLTRLGLGVNDFRSSLGFLFELSLSLSLSSDFLFVKLSLKVNQVCN